MKDFCMSQHTGLPLYFMFIDNKAVIILLFKV